MVKIYLNIIINMRIYLDRALMLAYENVYCVVVWAMGAGWLSEI